MAILYDARGNELQGALDQITGGTVTDARTITSTLSSLNAEVVMDLNGHAVACFDLRTAAGALTVSFEGMVDGSNYFPLVAINQSTEFQSLTAVSATTFAQTYFVGVTGIRRVRARVSAYTSGNIIIAARATLADYLIYTKPLPATTWVTATGAAAAAVTLTLPAPGAGLYHYITEVQIVKFATALLTVAATPVLVTTTNLTGSPVFSFNADAATQGTSQIQQFEPVQPFKGAVANTATTIVCPATTSLIWRVNVAYYVGA